MQNIQNAKSKTMQVALQSDAQVLITGPTGTGKSQLARKIHQEGKRKDLPFVEVNLATLHAGTFESELFGHDSGAFTGATKKRAGRLQNANGGTVFLDEIGELSTSNQAKLLEFLEEKRIFPLGESKPIDLNVRVIAATNRDLSAEVERGNFREDLYQRLKLVHLDLKPLAERVDELDFWVHLAIEKFSKQTGKKILCLSESVASFFESYVWPGNLRELFHVIEFAIHSCEQNVIELEDLPPYLFEAKNDKQKPLLASNVADLRYDEALKAFEREFFRAALLRHRGQRASAAQQVGVSRATFFRRLAELGI